ncbi:MAG: chemotaxis protein CheW [Phycisphaerales bacterium]|nr:chemotaxis protein CheW [Phycisphaerales bacterium]
MSASSPSNASPARATEQSQHTDAIQRLLDRPVTAADLDAGAELAALPAEARNRRTVRYLLFRIGGETAALPAMVLRRVTPAARAVPIPHRTAGVLRGVCNIRGELVLCADLRRLLGLPAHDREVAGVDGSKDTRCMIVVGPADNSWAFEVDALMGIEGADPSEFRAPPVTVEHAIGDFTLGVTEIGGRCVTVLDSDRVLAGFRMGLA